MSNFFDINKVDDLIEEIKYVYLSDDRPWIIGYSGGKDSTVVVSLVIEMLLSIKDSKKCKDVHIVSSDTMVENPIVSKHLFATLDALKAFAAEYLPHLHVHIVRPAADKTFWAYVIGRGYPTPKMNGTFRWCTDRLKIAPSSIKMREIIKESNEEVVMLLGVRKEESTARKIRIEGREIIGKLLNRHEVIEEAYVYNPIVDLTTEDVWNYLLTHNDGVTPWGYDNTNLFNLYGEADSECPFATELKKGEQSESCGKSRFGCWICTVVKEDRSLNGFIKSGYLALQPLAEFRRELIEMRDVYENRERKRRDGVASVGPFTWAARQTILRRLLETQKVLMTEFNFTEPLITLEELKAIDEIWDTELDLSRRTLVNLYSDVMNEKLPWDDYKKPLFDETICNMLDNCCDDYDIPRDLMTNLLLTTHKNKNFSNQKVLRDSLNKIFNQQWLHFDKTSAIDEKFSTKEITDYDS
ncbi:MAG: DNA phosphorothioation system sulfurtransferase DndC [Vagococcus sp.]